MEVSAVILAGGQGLRMGGRNKANLPFGSETFIDRQIRACKLWASEIIVVSNDTDYAKRLQRINDSLIVVPDRFAGEGPLAGLHAGFAAAACPQIWLLACDQPFANAAAARLLCDCLISSSAQAALPIMGGQPQPLHAVYDCEVGMLAERLLQTGKRRMRDLLEEIDWVGVDEAEFRSRGIPPNFTDDADTPEDYERLLNQQLPTSHNDKTDRN